MYKYFCVIVAVFTLLVALVICEFIMNYVYFKYFYTGDFNEKIK